MRRHASTLILPPFILGILLAVASVSSAGTQVPPPPPPPPPPPMTMPPSRDVATTTTGTATLAGMVVADDGSSRPVRRATVTVRGSGLPSGRVILTDDQGRFAFRDLPGGTLTMTVTKPGWVNGYYGARDSWRGPGTPLAIADGERRDGLELRIAPGAVVTGRILNQFGQPQAGARVLALERRRYGGQDMYSPARASSGLIQTTDDRGVYRLYGLPPGEFLIGANLASPPRSTTTLTTPEEVRWAEQLAESGLGGGALPPAAGPAVGYSPVFYPGVTDPAGAAPVELGVGEERTGVDFQLQFVSTARVSGTLQMPSGLAPSGVTLMMVSGARTTVTTSILSGSPMNRASVSPQGAFAFESVTPGEYLLTARASSQSPAPRGRGAGPAARPVMDLWASETVTVNGRDIDGVLVTMQPGLTLSGRVSFAGTTLEPPSSFSSVTVRLTSADEGQGVSVGVPPAQVHEDGTFTIPGIAPGRYVLWANAPRGAASDAAWVAHRADVGGRNTLDEPFDIRPGQDIEDVVVEFIDQASELSGQVTDADGQPVGGLTIVVFSADPGRWTPALASRFLRVMPLGTDGRYRVPALPAGNYYLAALAEIDQADLRDPIFLEQLRASAIPVALGLGERKTQDIQVRR